MMKKLIIAFFMLMGITATFAKKKEKEQKPTYPYFVHYQDGKTEEYLHCQFSRDADGALDVSNITHPTSKNWSKIQPDKVKSVTKQITDSTFCIYICLDHISDIKEKKDLDLSKGEGLAWFVISDVVGKITVLYWVNMTGSVYVDGDGKPSTSFLYREDFNKAVSTGSYVGYNLNPKIITAHIKEHEELVNYVNSFKKLPPRGETRNDFVKRIAMEYNQWYELQEK